MAEPVPLVLSDQGLRERNQFLVSAFDPAFDFLQDSRFAHAGIAGNARDDI